MQDIINAANPFTIPKWLSYGFAPMEQFDSYTTDHRFTVTNAGTATVAPVSYTGRPCCGVTYNSAITDGLQCQVPVAAFIPQVGHPVIVKASFASSIIGTAELSFGLHVVDTSIIAGKGSNYIAFEKLVGASTFTLSACKASGTAESHVIPFPTLASATWYDLGMVIERDPVTAGKGLITVGYKVAGAQGDGYQWLHQYPIATQFPDTVATCPYIATRSGYAAAVNYLGYLAWQL